MLRRAFLVCIPLLSFSYFADASPYSDGSVALAGKTQLVHHHRHLLQVLNQCPVNFATANYTIITSKCKGPVYPKQDCCDSFVEFACPFASAINDNTTNCATTMFSYINIYGKYPAGLFANECVGNSSLGLECPANATTPAPTSTSDGGSALAFGHFGGAILWLLFIYSMFMVLDTSLPFDHE